MSEPLRWDDGALLVLDQRAAARRGGVAALRDARAGGRGDPHAGRARGARHRAGGRVRAGAGRRPARPRPELLRAARPTAREPRPGRWSARWRADDPLALARDAPSRAGARPTARSPSWAPSCSREGDRALTHCNTGALATGGYGTAGGVLRAAWDARPAGAGVGDETRPLLQGARLTAWELERAGHPAPRGHGLERRGADGARAGGPGGGRRGPDRGQRRRGQQGRHLPARRARRPPRHPVLVAAPVSTLDPATATGAQIPIEERDPAEVLATAPGGVGALNLAFDVTPAELVGAVVTEAGVLGRPTRRRSRGWPADGRRAAALGGPPAALHRHRRGRRRGGRARHRRGLPALRRGATRWSAASPGSGG